MNIKAIKNGFIFQFVDAVNAKGEFEKGTTDTGIILKATFDDSAKQPRWVNVVSVGPECKNIKEGDQVLLPALRWTAASKLEGQSIWKSDETQIVARRPRGDSTNSLVPLASYVIFTPVKSGTATASASGLLVVIGNVGDTPKGTVVQTGPDASPELTVGSTIFYNDANFFETFTDGGTEYAFIKDENILMFEPAETN
jgi:co-chaperonin GroES (HSP10)